MMMRGPSSSWTQTNKINPNVDVVQEEEEEEEEGGGSISSYCTSPTCKE